MLPQSIKDGFSKFFNFSGRDEEVRGSLLNEGNNNRQFVIDDLEQHNSQEQPNLYNPRNLI